LDAPQPFEFLRHRLESVLERRPHRTYPPLDFHPQVLLDQVVILVFQPVIQLVVRLFAFLAAGSVRVFALALLDGSVVDQVFQLLSQPFVIV
jgi:hypothetical protein